MSVGSNYESKLLPTGSLIDAIEGPEIVFGLVGAVGTDLSAVTEVIAEQLKLVRYTSSVIRISAEMHAIDPDLPTGGPLDEHYECHMKAGTAIREALGRGDALALLAVSAIASERRQLSSDSMKPVERHAYIVRSLKHPAEVECLRRIYGRMFFLVAAYSPRDQRKEMLARDIAASHYVSRSENYYGVAENLIDRDEEEYGTKLGQRLRDTFQLADIFVRGDDRHNIEIVCRRFIEIVFGYPFHTPTIDEQSMFYARASALRSADLSRQVGAVITDGEGAVLASGCNEVPKSGGGAYWADDPNDKRDFRVGYDPSAKIKQEMLEEILDRLGKANWLVPEKSAVDARKLAAEASIGKNNPLMRGARLMDLLEFGRVVHAEMAALSDASRRGVRVEGGTLYCTTFPCHMCVRHMIAAGIKRVFYIEPYPKSMAKRLYPDSISLDDSAESRMGLIPFSGIAPNRFVELFAMSGDRKNDDGTVVRWEPSKSLPREKRFILSYLLMEQKAGMDLRDLLEKAAIKLTDSSGIQRSS